MVLVLRQPPTITEIHTRLRACRLEAAANDFNRISTVYRKIVNRAAPLFLERSGCLVDYHWGCPTDYRERSGRLVVCHWGCPTVYRNIGMFSRLSMVMSY